MQKSISIVIPVHNEVENIPLVYRAVKAVLNTLPAYTYEIIFINDGSSDDSQKAINALSAEDLLVRGIEFTRNFGKEAATTAGIREAVGDAVICLDADLQHPPELIVELVHKWERGAEVVVGVRSDNSGEGIVKRWGSKLFYAIMSRIGETEMLSGETDFRLIDRTVADVFSALSERGRMTRSLINWLGFKKEIVYFVAPSRLHGQAQYSVSKLVRLAFNTIASNSLVPLRLAGYLGLLITGLSFILGLIVFVERYIYNDVLNWHVTGAAQLTIINVFLIGIVLMALGILALYIGRINEEISRRPLYVARKRR